MARAGFQIVIADSHIHLRPLDEFTLPLGFPVACRHGCRRRAVLTASVSRQWAAPGRRAGLVPEPSTSHAAAHPLRREDGETPGPTRTAQGLSVPRRRPRVRLVASVRRADPPRRVGNLPYLLERSPRLKQRQYGPFPALVSHTEKAPSSDPGARRAGASQPLRAALSRTPPARPRVPGLHPPEGLTAGSETVSGKVC